MYENYRVLFVDDEQNILNSLRRGLLDESYYCIFALSGKEALKIIEEETISVIVTDMRMPEMNGLELLKIVDEVSPSTIKVALSGYTQLPQILATINQVDIFKFLTKPWVLEDLIHTIRKALDYYIINEEHEQYKKALEAKNRSYQNILKKINEIIENANKSREMLGIAGKAILGFSKDFSEAERQKYDSILKIQDTLFEILSVSLSYEKKLLEPNVLAGQLSAHLLHTIPQASIEKVIENNSRVNVDINMLELSIKALLALFFDEFDEKGLYSKFKCNNVFSITIICPNIEPEPSPETPTLLDMKIRFFKSVFEEILEICGLKLQLVSAKGSLLIEVSFEMVSKTPESEKSDKEIH